MNEELQKANEGLQRTMHRQVRRNMRTRSPNMSARDNPLAFSRAIMEELIPPHFITQKITPFSGVADPEGHLKAL